MANGQDPNERQVGGSHYHQTQYQHWDWMADNFGADYFIGQASKYLIRWKSKGGLQDLMKSSHYLEKLSDLIQEHRVDFPKHKLPVNTSTICEQYNCGPVEAGLLIAFTCFTTMSELQRMRRALDLYIEQQQKSQP